MEMPIALIDHEPLYVPPDIAYAARTWAASAGPICLAAMLRQPVNAVYPLCRHFSRRGWINFATMGEALGRAAAGVGTGRGSGAGAGGGSGAGVRYWIAKPWGRIPRYGLAFIQLRGPWERESIKEQYQRTHWLGAAMIEDKTPYIFDAGGWQSFELWRSKVLPIVSGNAGGNGKCYVRSSYEIRLGRAQ